jgi:PAS domain S-box-containing protein
MTAPSRASMEAILDCIAQPVWVVDPDGLISFVNPAGLAALGYDDLSQVEGLPGHETIHYKRRDGSHFPAAECPMSISRETGETVVMEEDWFVRRDGSMFPVSYVSKPIDMPGGQGVVVAFTDIASKRRAEQAARERDIAQARAEELAIARRRIIEATDVARAQLERDLHDGAQQQFVTALIYLRLAETSGPDEARQLRAQAMALADAGLAEMRRLAAGIHPAILTDRGLGPAVEALASRLPLPVEVLETPSARLPSPVEASVYFVVSEALANVIKHAGAEQATVSIQAEDGELRIEVRDDGRGGARAGAGSGLRGLGDRVGALDGSLELSSPPGQGTTLRARIPLEA